jgi:hypothetical protein
MNEGTIDRIIRLIVGAILIYLGFFSLSGVFGIIIGIIGIILFITGITGFCLLYKVIGCSTKKVS